MGPTSTNNTDKDRGVVIRDGYLAMDGDPPASQVVSAAGVHGTNEPGGTDAPGQRTALQVVGDLLGFTPDPMAELKVNNRRLKTENHDLKAKTSELWATIQSLRPENHDLKARNSELRATIHALKSQNEQHIKALESREREHNIKLDEKRTQLEQKEVEIAEMKKTLCMYDACSEADINNMVDAINTRVQSFSRNLAGRWIKDASKLSDGDGDQKPVTEEEAASLSGVIGAPFVNTLYSSTPGQTKYAAYFLQVAWRACIVATVTKVLSSFSASLAGTTEGVSLDVRLRDLSGKVMNGEPQPAYGRWRYITHRYLKQVFPDEERAIQFYASEALSYCRTAGRLVLKTRCPDDHVFTTSFEMKLKEIMADAVKLLTTFQERWTTTNFEPYTPDRGDQFLADRMEVGNQDEQFDDDHVVCIIGLGLLYSGKKAREKTSGEPVKYIFKKVQVFTENNHHKLIAGV